MTIGVKMVVRRPLDHGDANFDPIVLVKAIPVKLT
jgi:hypothetical protein